MRDIGREWHRLWRLESHAPVEPVQNRFCFFFVLFIGWEGGWLMLFSDLPPNPGRTLTAKRLKGMKARKGGCGARRARERTGGRRAEERTEMKGAGRSESDGSEGKGGGQGGRGRRESTHRSWR